MTPLLLLGLFGLGWVVTKKIASSSSTAPVKGERLVVLDANLPDAARDQALQAILYEKNPAQLDALQAAFHGHFPCAEYEMAYRAWELRGQKGTAPARPGSCNGPASTAPSLDPTADAGIGIPGATNAVVQEACQMIDPTLPGDACKAVLIAIARETDPQKLDAFAASLAGAHPRAASVLGQRAAVLRQQAGAPPPPSPAPVPGPAPDIKPASREIDHSGGVPDIVAENAPGRTHGRPEPSYAPMEPALAVAASLSPSLEGTTHHAEGTGAGLAEAAVAQAAGVAEGGPPSGADPFRVGVARNTREPTQRPRGHWFVFVRAHDTPWPLSLVKAGTGKKDPQALGQLFALNPHLWTTPTSGVITQFLPGSEVNVPGAWSEALVRRGFKVKKDG